MNNRVSCRNFIDKKISISILDKIIEIAKNAPNGCCRQTVRYHITQDKDKIDKIVPCVAGITNFSAIPCIVAVCANCSFYELIDKNLQYIDSSLSAENFVLAASIFGVYGTICNFFRATHKEKDICRNTLSIPKHENIVMFIVIGYPSSLPEKPTRRKNKEFYTIH